MPKRSGFPFCAEEEPHNMEFSASKASIRASRDELTMLRSSNDGPQGISCDVLAVGSEGSSCTQYSLSNCSPAATTKGGSGGIGGDGRGEGSIVGDLGVTDRLELAERDCKSLFRCLSFALFALGSPLLIGDAKRFPRLTSGSLRTSPPGKCREQTRVCGFKSASESPNTTSHLDRFSGLLGKR